MVTMIFGTEIHNAGVMFCSTPDWREAPECAIFDEETGEWHWADTIARTPEQRQMAIEFRANQLSNSKPA